jgi:hypothetical protein
MISPEVARHGGRVRRLVVIALRKANRKRFHRTATLPLEQRNDGGRIDSAR